MPGRQAASVGAGESAMKIPEIGEPVICFAESQNIFLMA